MSDTTSNLSRPLMNKVLDTFKNEPLSPEQTWKYAERSLAWYGWGSPVGLGIMLLCIGGLLVCLRHAQLLP